MTAQFVPDVRNIDRARFEAEIVPAGRPVVLRGVVGDWPATKRGQESPEAICRYLIERDNGAPVDAIMLPPEEHGRIFYNASFDGFNFLKNRLPISRVIEQMARYSAFASAPSVAAQSALIRECLPRFLDDNRLHLLDAVEPRIWLGNAIITPAHFDESHNIACVVAGRRSTICTLGRSISRRQGRRSVWSTSRSLILRASRALPRRARRP
jgi:hypothetical protein